MMISIFELKKELPIIGFFGDESVKLRCFVDFDHAGKSVDEITWCSGALENVISENFQGTVICRMQSTNFQKPVGCNLIVVENPRDTFALVLNNYFSREYNRNTRRNTFISDCSTCDQSVAIGDNVSIFDNCSIGRGVVIGDGSVISNAIIHDNVKIGRNTNIGNIGFGFAKSPDGRAVRIAHNGGVEIRSGTEIGANVCIDRGVLADTVIAENVLIDNNVNISHNVHIRECSRIFANATLCGSVQIQRDVHVGPGAIVKNKIKIGAGARVAMGSVVTSNISEHMHVAGNPCRKIT